VRNEAFVAQPPNRTFPRRRNSDGTFDSICSQCFLIISTSSLESELAEAEKAHVCVGLNLSNMFYPANLK
jgi:hypothetical protein